MLSDTFEHEFLCFERNLQLGLLLLLKMLMGHEELVTGFDLLIDVGEGPILVLLLVV